MPLAGHNKGKKFIPGVGYKFPEKQEKPKKKHICSECGKRRAVLFFADGNKLCEPCDQRTIL